MSRVKAKFTNEIKQAILERDEYKCILCWSLQVADIHHVYFWLQNESDETRNNIDKWVSLCRNCHDWCHSCKSWYWSRQETINYLNEYYDR